MRGIATSGWRGRSFSLGIADSGTVIAASAAAADAAATLIANAVKSSIRRIVRRRANELEDDSDLGDLLVTVARARVAAEAVDAALAGHSGGAAATIAQGRIASQQCCRCKDVAVVEADVLDGGGDTGVSNPGHGASPC